MLSEHKDLKLSNTAFQISEWNPTFPDGDGRSYGSPNLPPCASSLPRSLLLSPWAGISWTSVLGKHSSRTSSAPAPQRTRRDVGTEAGEGGRGGRMEGEQKTREWKGKRKEEGVGGLLTALKTAQEWKQWKTAIWKWSGSFFTKSVSGNWEKGDRHWGPALWVMQQRWAGCRGREQEAQGLGWLRLAQFYMKFCPPQRRRGNYYVKCCCTKPAGRIFWADSGDRQRMSVTRLFLFFCDRFSPFFSVN